MAQHRDLHAMKDVDGVEIDAYKRSVEWMPQDVTAFLVERVGVQVTAVGVGLADGRPVRMWQNGEAKPRPETEVRLRLLFRVTWMLDAVYGPATARAFLRGASPYLGNRSPLEVIADDDPTEAAPDVLAAARAFLEG